MDGERVVIALEADERCRLRLPMGAEEMLAS
jgi:hypothetical protein